MKCEALINSMGFDCEDVGHDTLRVWSPFTYGSDGQLVGVYVEKSSSGYRVTDHAEALMHASALGINLTPKRIDAIRRSVPRAEISSGGVISTVVDDEALGDGIASVLSALLAVGHFESGWMPRDRSESFTRRVREILEDRLGVSAVEREVKVTAGSGHQLEIPLIVITSSRRLFVQPVASDEDEINWDNVYEGLGKMTDLKNADAEDASRVVVLQTVSSDKEQAKAITLLSTAATVIEFPKLSSWAERLAA